MPEVKDKERLLKAVRERLATFRGVPIRLSADFSKETLQARGDWQEIFKVRKSRNLQPRLLYPEKLSLKSQKTGKDISRQEKAERVHHHQTIII